MLTEKTKPIFEKWYIPYIREQRPDYVKNDNTRFMASQHKNKKRARKYAILEACELLNYMKKDPQAKCVHDMYFAGTYANGNELYICYDCGKQDRRLSAIKKIQKQDESDYVPRFCKDNNHDVRDVNDSESYCVNCDWTS